MTPRRVFVAVFLVYAAYAWPMPAPMALRQLYFSRSVAERTLTLDAYAPGGVECAVVGSHCYSVTPPLEGVLGAPVVAVTKHVLGPSEGRWPRREEVLALVPYTLVFGALAGALGAALLSATLLALGAEPRRAALGALAFALATPHFPYGTIAYQNELSNAGVLVAVLGLARGGRGHAVAGLGLGLAVLADYNAVAVAIVLGLGTLLASGVRSAALLALGAAGPAAALLAFHAAATGSPFDPPVRHFSHAVPQTATGGGWPALVPFLHLVAGPWKGLFLAFPILALGAFGLVRLGRERPERRGFVRALLAAAFANVLLVSGMPFWFAPESFGPRYLLPAVACLAVGIPWGLAALPRRWGIALVAISFVVAWAGAQTSWQFGTFDAPLELILLGPRLRGVVMLVALLAPGRDAELWGALAAVAMAPLLATVVLALIGERKRWALVAFLSSAALLVPYLAWGRGREDAVRGAAAIRGVKAEASLMVHPVRLAILGQTIVDGDPDGARKILWRAVRLAPADPEVLSQCVRGFVAADDMPSAHIAGALLKKARPQDGELLVLGLIELHASDPAGARALMRDLLTAHPELARRRELRALVAEVASGS